MTAQDPTQARDPRELYADTARETLLLRAGGILRAATEIVTLMLTDTAYPTLRPAVLMYCSANNIPDSYYTPIHKACCALLDIPDIRMAVYGV